MAEIHRKINVVHVVEGCFGGISTFVSMMIRSQLNDPMIGEIHVIADRNDAESWFMDLPVHFHAYEGSRAGRRIFPIAKHIEAILRGIGPDLVILHNTYAGLWGRLAHNRTWRTVYCAHGWSFAQNVSLVRKLFYGAAEAVLSFRCDAIVSISPHEYRAARIFGVWGAKHYLIRHGVPPAAPDPAPQLALDPAAINIAFVGRFERQKGVDLLKQMFDDPALNDIHLWLVGGNVRGTPEIPFPEKANVTRLGWLSRGGTDAVLQQVDALIVPSRWEGFGLVAIEAMRSGRPVLASDVGGLSSLVTPGVDGYVMNVKDIAACRALLGGLTKEKLIRMGEAAMRTYQEHFRWEDCYAKWQQIILRALA